MASVVIVYHSGFGHTEKLAQHVQKGAQSVAGVDVQLIKAEEAAQQWDVFNAADAIIFGAPTYMGSASAPFKAFMDASSALWFEKKWQDKLAAGFTNSHSLNGDKLSTLTQMAVFAAQHGMIWVSLGIANETAGDVNTSGDPNLINRLGSSLGAMAQSENDSPDITPPKGDLKTAELLGERVAKLAKRWQG